METFQAIRISLAVLLKEISISVLISTKGQKTSQRLPSGVKEKNMQEATDAFFIPRTPNLFCGFPCLPLIPNALTKVK